MLTWFCQFVSLYGSLHPIEFHPIEFLSCLKFEFEILELIRTQLPLRPDHPIWLKKSFILLVHILKLYIKWYLLIFLHACYDYCYLETMSYIQTMNMLLFCWMNILYMSIAGHILCFLFVTVKIYRDSAFSAGELLAVALAHAFALFAAVSASMHVSGGHVNPAVTFGALIGGRISVVRAIYYWIAQLLGAIVAALLLRLVTNNMVNRNTFDKKSVTKMIYCIYEKLN